MRNFKIGHCTNRSLLIHRITYFLVNKKDNKLKLTTISLLFFSNGRWHKFPVAGFVAMASAIVTMMIDSAATSYYKRSHFSKARPLDEEEMEGDPAGGAHAGHVQVHVHATHGHSHGPVHSHGQSDMVGGSLPEGLTDDTLMRHRVISQVNVTMLLLMWVLNCFLMLCPSWF